MREIDSAGQSTIRNQLIMDLEPGAILTPFQRRAHLINRELLRRGESQDAFADRAGISRRALCSILSGEYRGRRENLLRIAELLWLRPNDLLVSWRIDCDCLEVFADTMPVINSEAG